MIKYLYLMMRNRKGDLTWTQIIAAIITLIILVLMIYVSLKSRSGMDETTKSFLDFL